MQIANIIENNNDIISFLKLERRTSIVYKELLSRNIYASSAYDLPETLQKIYNKSISQFKLPESLDKENRTPSPLHEKQYILDLLSYCKQSLTANKNESTGKKFDKSINNLKFTSCIGNKNLTEPKVNKFDKSSENSNVRFLECSSEIIKVKEKFCRICKEDDENNDNKLISICCCVNPLQYTHIQCMFNFLFEMVNRLKICEICNEPYRFTILKKKECKFMKRRKNAILFVLLITILLIITSVISIRSINQYIFIEFLILIISIILIFSIIFHFRYLFGFNYEEKWIFYNSINNEKCEFNLKANSFSPRKIKKLSIEKIYITDNNININNTEHVLDFNETFNKSLSDLEVDKEFENENRCNKFTIRPSLNFIRKNINNEELDKIVEDEKNIIQFKSNLYK